jgi:hypothetical protein
MDDGDDFDIQELELRDDQAKAAAEAMNRTLLRGGRRSGLIETEGPGMIWPWNAFIVRSLAACSGILKGVNGLARFFGTYVKQRFLIFISTENRHVALAQ